MRSGLHQLSGDWAGEPGGGGFARDGRLDDHRAVSPVSDPGAFPSAIEFVKAAALRIRDADSTIREQAERIDALEAERAESDARMSELEAIVGRHHAEHLGTLELLEQSWVECSLLRVALREAAREAETAERHIRSSIKEIADLKGRFGQG